MYAAQKLVALAESYPPTACEEQQHDMQRNTVSSKLVTVGIKTLTCNEQASSLYTVCCVPAPS